MRVFVFLLVLLVACTLPKGQQAPEDFVTSSEQETIQFVRIGNDYYRQGRFVLAELEYRKALHLFPEAQNIQVNLANSLIKTRQLDEAGEIITDLLDSEPDNIEYVLLASKLADESDEYAQARQYYLGAADLSFEQDRKKYLVGIFQNLSSLSFRLANEEAAYCYAQQALELSGKGLQQKQRLSRLASALGIKKTFKLGDGKISQADRERLSWDLMLAYASGEMESMEELLAQISVLEGEDGKLLSVEEYIKAMSQESEGSADELGNLKELQTQLLPEGELSPSSALYWPAKLIMDLRKVY